MENPPTATPESQRQGKMLGRYQLQQLLATGSRSEVWLATDTQLQRQVALKIFPAFSQFGSTALRDFAQEARAAASLEHPHILDIHDFGEQELVPGEIVPFLVMPYIAGGTLADKLKKLSGLLPIQESLRYLHHAAQAIDYAHSRRILHRAIKPANMLLRDDWLLLADFSLARVLQTNMVQGHTAVNYGSPEYMAPEQISGQATPASDRYSLALVAYQLFTGRLPYHGKTAQETVALQLQASLPAPRQFNSIIPPGVEDLLQRALARQPEMRPPDCVTFTTALQRAWMSGVSSMDEGTDPEATKLAPWSKRAITEKPGKPGPAVPPVGQNTGVIALPPGLSVPGLPVPGLPVPGPASSPGHANSNSSPYPPPIQGGSSSPALPSHPQVGPTPPQGAYTPTPPTLVQPGLTGGVPMPATPSYSGFQASQPGLVGMPGHDSGSDNGQLGAVQMALANMPTNAPTVPSPFRLSRRAVLAASTLAAGLAVGGGVLAWYKLRNMPATQQKGHAITPTPTIATGPKNLVAGTPLLQLAAHTNYIWTAAWDPTGRYLLTAGKDGNIFIWDIATAVKNAATSPKLTQPLYKFTVADLIFDNETAQICWSQDGKKLLIVGMSSSTSSTASKIYVLDPFTAGSTPVSYSDYDDVIMGNNPIYGTVTAGPGNDDFTVLNGGTSGTQAQVWSMAQTEVPTVIYDVAESLSRVCWSADGSLLAGLTSGLSEKMALLLWEKTNPRHPQEWNLPTRDFALTFFRLADTLNWSPVDSHYLLISNVDQVLIWDRRVNKAALTLQANTSSNAPVITGASWSPNGRYAATSYAPDGSQVTQVTFTNPEIMVWDVQNLLKTSNSSQAQLPLLTFKSQVSTIQHTDAITDLNWSPDGKYLATASFDKTVIVWKVDR